MNEQGGSNAYPTSSGTIPCRTWSLQLAPRRLPAIPILPDMPDAGLSIVEMNVETQLVEIAAFSDGLLGLTNKGHVLKFANLRSECSYGNGTWEYVRTVRQSNSLFTRDFHLSFHVSVKPRKYDSTMVSRAAQPSNVNLRSHKLCA